MGFPESSDGRKSACSARDLGLIPGLGRFPGEGNNNSLQYSGLEKSTDRGAHGLQSMGFLRQEYWNGLPSPSPGDFPDPGIEPTSPTLWADALPSEPPKKAGHVGDI